MKVTVRKAAAADEGPIFDMLREHALYLLPGAEEFDPAKSAAMIHDTIGTSVIAEADGEVVGVLLMVVAAPWYSSRRFLRGVVLFVRPDARSGTAARRMMRAATRASEKYGLPFVLEVTSGSDILRKDAFFTRLGMTAMGGTYIYGG